MLLKVVGLENFDFYSNLTWKVEYNVVLDQCGSKHQERCHWQDCLVYMTIYYLFLKIQQTDKKLLTFQANRSIPWLSNVVTKQEQWVVVSPQPETFRKVDRCQKSFLNVNFIKIHHYEQKLFKFKVNKCTMENIGNKITTNL